MNRARRHSPLVGLRVDAALAVDLPGVTVADGKLTLDLTASVDYPALSGIEIVR